MAFSIRRFAFGAIKCCTLRTILPYSVELMSTQQIDFKIDEWNNYQCYTQFGLIGRRKAPKRIKFGPKKWIELKRKIRWSFFCHEGVFYVAWLIYRRMLPILFFPITRFDKLPLKFITIVIEISKLFFFCSTNGIVIFFIKWFSKHVFHPLGWQCQHHPPRINWVKVPCEFSI